MQVLIIIVWLSGSILASLLSIRHLYRTGKPQSTLATLALALAGSFLYYLWPKMGRLSDMVAFGLVPALVLAIAAVLWPLLVNMLQRRDQPRA